VKIEPRLNQTLNQDSTGTLERLGRTILDGLPSHPTTGVTQPRYQSSNRIRISERQTAARSAAVTWRPGRDRESEHPGIADVAEAVKNA
jgi:hypothetical protein